MLKSGAFYVLRRALCYVIFATGTMLAPLCGSSVLLLLAFLPFVSGVCPSCHGDAPGCTSTDWASCLWNQGLATNVAAFAVVGATGVAKLGTLLPPKLLKMFIPRTVERLQMLSSRLRHGQSEDLTGKTFSDVAKAKRAGKASAEEVNTYMIERYTAADGDATKQTKILEEMKMLEKIPCGFFHISNSEGTLLFIMAKLSHAACTSKRMTLEYCAEVDSSLEPHTSASGAAGSTKATLLRPSEYAQLVVMLNHFLLVTVSLGICHLTHICTFFDLVVYEPVRTGSIPWEVAFECLIIYLRMVEEHPTMYSVGTVVAKAGGMDAVRAEALQSAEVHGSFRRPRGEPRDVTNPAAGKGKPGDPFTGIINGDNPTATKGCTAWNLGKPHLCKHVGPGGYCVFKHACDHFVTDKGPFGQCLRCHKRGECDYDAAKKCDKPVKA